MSVPILFSSHYQIALYHNAEPTKTVIKYSGSFVYKALINNVLISILVFLFFDMPPSPIVPLHTSISSTLLCSAQNWTDQLDDSMVQIPKTTRPAGNESEVGANSSLEAEESSASSILRAF